MQSVCFLIAVFDNSREWEAWFVLNQTKLQKIHKIIIAGQILAAFSRETAVWAAGPILGPLYLLHQAFGDIFYTNCFNNMMCNDCVTSPRKQALLYLHHKRGPLPLISRTKG